MEQTVELRGVTLLLRLKMKSPIVRITERLLLILGIAALVFAGSAVLTTVLYQRYEAWRYFHTAAVRKASDLERWHPREGDILGRLEVPRVHVSVMVIEGATD